MSRNGHIFGFRSLVCLPVLCVLALGVGGLAPAPATAATVLPRLAAFDINSSTNTGATQSGFAALNDGTSTEPAPAGTFFSATQSGITLTVSNHRGDRDRLADGNLLGHPRAELLRDFAFNTVVGTGAAAVSTYMTAQLTGLKPNAPYLVRIHGYDPDSNNRAAGLWFDGRTATGDWTATGFLGMLQNLSSYPGTGHLDTTITSSAAGEITLRTRGSSSWSSMSLLNGVEVFDPSGAEYVLRVDMNNTNAAQGPVNATQNGFVGLALSNPSSGTGSVTANGVTVTVTTDRTDATRNRNNTGESLFSDFVCADNRLDLQIAGLAVGQEYLFTVYSQDTNGNGASASRWYLNDPDMSDPNNLIRTMQWTVGNATGVSPAGAFSFLVTPDSPTVTLTATDAYNNSSGNVTGLIFFNGLEIQSVPEPATLALLSLASASLGGYLRRRRR